MNKNYLKREIKETDDGSHTLYIPYLDEYYHSHYGAIQESKHIFVEKGLKYFDNKKTLNVFELGFGTGLNSLLTLDFGIKNNCNIYYESIEKYPLKKDEYEHLNFTNYLETDLTNSFKQMHNSVWEEKVNIDKNFCLKKVEGTITNFKTNKSFDIVFFDAFAPDKQPELWSVEIFKQMYAILNSGGILVTYSAKGQVRRNMQTVGFNVERLEGPPGKREMLRAIKPIN